MAKDEKQQKARCPICESEFTEYYRYQSGYNAYDGWYEWENNHTCITGLADRVKALEESLAAISNHLSAVAGRNLR